DLTAGVDLDGTGEIALRHRGRDLGDRADLRGQVRGQQVDVAGQVLPGAGRSGHVRLPAEPALDPDLSSNARHLIRTCRPRARHVVDGRGECRDLALRVHGEVLLQVAVGYGGYDLDDAAHLLRQIGSHHVDVVGEALPGAGDSWNLRLSAELALGA